MIIATAKIFFLIFSILAKNIGNMFMKNFTYNKTPNKTLNNNIAIFLTLFDFSNSFNFKHSK